MEDSQNDLITVVLTTYNRGHLIKRAIDSVLNQTYSNFELIIVDDASKDKTYKIINSYSDKRIRYIKLDENTKGTKTRNIGIQNSRGKYIALLDSDDEWKKNKLETQLNYIKSFDNPRIMCFTDVIFKEKLKCTIAKNNPYKDENIIDYIIIGNNFVQTSTFMFPSKLGKEILFGNIQKHQDWDFCLRLQRKGVRFLHLPVPLTIYHIDKRENRIATNRKYELSLLWINSIRNEISEKAYYAFLANKVASTLIINKKRKTALIYYIKAFQNESISIKNFIKGVLKCMLPRSFWTIKWGK